jgi:hypothetical protein
MVHFTKIPPSLTHFIDFQHFSGTGTPFWDFYFAWDWVGTLVGTLLSKGPWDFALYGALLGF